MANKSTTDVILAIRQHSNTVNRKVVTDDEVLARANEGLGELYDLIDGAHGTYFVKPYNFSLTGGYGNNTAPLPSDFYRAKALDKSPDTSAMRSVNALPSFAERNNPQTLSYDLEDVANIMLVPPPLAHGDYRLRYIPKCPVLASPIVVQAQGIPPAPSTGPLPLPLKTWIIAKVHNAVVDPNGGPNQNDLLVKVKNALVASGKWACVSSCDGSTVSTSDLWADWTKLKGFAFGVFSFIILRNAALGCEIMITTPTTVGWTEMGLTYSASGAFTGGTTTVYPTAPDQIGIGSGSWLGRFPAASPTYYAITWVSSDGTATRVGWFYLGHLVAWWQWDATFMGGVRNTSGWTSPFVAVAYGTTFTPSTDWVKMTANNFASGGGSAAFPKFALIPGTPGGNSVYGSREMVTDASNVPNPINTEGAMPNPWAHRYVWAAPQGMFAVNAGSPNQGFLGYVQDQWWTGTGFNDGDTIDGGRFIIVGESIMPYDNTLTPPIGGGSSTDYSATSFYGRATL